MLRVEDDGTSLDLENGSFVGSRSTGFDGLSAPGKGIRE